MKTFAATLGLTTRAVSTVELDGQPARLTLMTRSFLTDPADLWEALTDPDRIPRWFLPIKGEFRVGGSYQLEGNAGGTIEECEPPRRLRVTWVMGGAPTWLTLTLRPGGSGTELELEHVGQVPQELWDQFGPSATGIGWDLAFNGLREHLSTGAASDPKAAAAWMASPEGLAFMQASAQFWQQADVAAGASPDEAASRARRTIAAYTGQPEPPQP